MLLKTLLLLVLLCSRGLASQARMGPTETPEMRFQKGSAYLARGKFEVAETYFTALTKVAPDRPRYWWGLGLSKKARGLNEEAVACWLKTLKLDPAMWRCYEQLTQSYHKLGKFKERDEAISKINGVKKNAAKGSALEKKDFFCRERFKVKGQLVLALQYFDGDERKIRFSVGDQDLGEQRFTELRHFDYPKVKDLSLLAFCEVTKGPDTCLAIYEKMPSYQELKDIVVTRLSGKDRGPSTQAERALFIKLLPIVTKYPLEPWSAVCRSWGVRFISEIPDIVVSLDFTAIDPLIKKGYKYEVTLVGHFTMAAGVPAVKRPKDKVLLEETTLFAMNSLLDVYESLMKEDKEAKLAFLDEALQKRAEGKLEEWLKDRPKRYEAAPRPKN